VTDVVRRQNVTAQWLALLLLFTVTLGLGTDQSVPAGTWVTLAQFAMILITVCATDCLNMTLCADTSRLATAMNLTYTLKNTAKGTAVLSHIFEVSEEKRKNLLTAASSESRSECFFRGCNYVVTSSVRVQSLATRYEKQNEDLPIIYLDRAVTINTLARLLHEVEKTWNRSRHISMQCQFLHPCISTAVAKMQ
jgi:hypothetical protein